MGRGARRVSASNWGVFLGGGKYFFRAETSTKLRNLNSFAACLRLTRKRPALPPPNPPRNFHRIPINAIQSRLNSTSSTEFTRDSPNSSKLLEIA